MTRKPFVFLALAWLSFAAAAAQTPAPHQAQIDALMSRYAGDVPGASLLVVKDGKTVIARGYGYANMEEHTKAGPETNYRLASVTKQFTAASILLLKQDGKLKLTDPVRKYLPELPASDDKITIENLLTHTSGLVDYEDLIPSTQTAQIDDNDVLRMIASQDRLYFQPGSAHRYSNGGYVLLGLIVQRVSGMDLADFMKQRIFKPLGMNHTLMYEHHRGPKPANRAYGYSLIDGKWTRTDQSVTSATRGDGGIYSNIEDFAKWDAALYTDKLLDADSRKLAFTPKDPIADPDTDYGFGWRLSGDTEWHSGESQGFRNVIIRWPKQHVTVVILSNRNHFKPYPLALTIGELFLAH
ncbi:MAG: beta-lactamase family protein [Xanthomonadales bacterium]|nr:beta-lactamase family protein [Xanthomonadales bacterium]ODU95188.1 MAG: serine hydrolase [Rhodanobacter sp. SCN 66-43]OJY82917.1 MAG: serine hydrolase [Xanthomonadales bacterium 66-474]